MLFLFILVKECQPFVGRRIKVQAADRLSVVVVDKDGEVGLSVPVCHTFSRNSRPEYGFYDVNASNSSTVVIILASSFSLLSVVCSVASSSVFSLFSSLSFMAAFRRSEMVSLI